MKIITSILKKKCFTQDQKRYLYNELRKESENEYKELSESVDNFGRELIIKYILPEDTDLGYLARKDYCSTTSSVYIDAEVLSLPSEYNNYPGKDKKEIPAYIQNINVGINIGIYVNDKSPIRGFPTATKRYGSVDVTKKLLEKCPPTLIDVLKDKMLELARVKYDYMNYKAEELLEGNGRYHIIPFLRIMTWGQLLRKNEAWFNILYEKYEKNLSEEETGMKTKTPETIDDEIRSVREFLGFGE